MEPFLDKHQTHHFCCCHQKTAKTLRLSRWLIQRSKMITWLLCIQKKESTFKCLEIQTWHFMKILNRRSLNTLTWILPPFCLGTLIPIVFKYRLITNRTLSLKSMEDKSFILEQILASSFKHQAKAILREIRKLCLTVQKSDWLAKNKRALYEDYRTCMRELTKIFRL